LQAALQLDETADVVAGEPQALLQACQLSCQLCQLFTDGGQPLLSLLDLAGDGAGANEPAAVMLRVAEFILAGGGAVGLQGDLRLEQRLLGDLEALDQAVAGQFGALEGQVGLVALQATPLKVGQDRVGLSLASDEAIGDAPTAVGGALGIVLLDALKLCTRVRTFGQEKRRTKGSNLPFVLRDDLS